MKNNLILLTGILFFTVSCGGGSGGGNEGSRCRVVGKFPHDRVICLRASEPFRSSRGSGSNQDPAPIGQCGLALEGLELQLKCGPYKGGDPRDTTQCSVRGYSHLEFECGSTFHY